MAKLTKSQLANSKGNMVYGVVLKPKWSVLQMHTLAHLSCRRTDVTCGDPVRTTQYRDVCIIKSI